jgi:hypothetical protein
VQRADLESAKLYEEFVVSFQGDDEGGLKTFVRGEVGRVLLQPTSPSLISAAHCSQPLR